MRNKTDLLDDLVVSVDLQPCAALHKIKQLFKTLNTRKVPKMNYQDTQSTGYRDMTYMNKFYEAKMPQRRYNNPEDPSKL